MDQKLYDLIQEMQRASYFKTRGDSGDRIVDSPFLGGPIASAFERLTRFSDSVLEVGRLGIHEVHEVCCGLDVVEDGLGAFDLIAKWKVDGAIAVRRMAGGRC